jgi:hypothetical protein
MKKIFKIVFVVMVVAGVFSGCGVKKATAKEVSELDIQGNKNIQPKTNQKLEDEVKLSQLKDKCQKDAKNILAGSIRAILVKGVTSPSSTTSALITQDSMTSSTKASLNYSKCMGYIDNVIVSGLSNFILTMSKYNNDFDKYNNIEDFKKLLYDVAKKETKKYLKQELKKYGKKELKEFYDKKIKHKLDDEDTSVESLKKAFEEFLDEK